MGVFDWIKKKYREIDQRVGGYLPGGVSPGSSGSSGSTSSGSSSSGSYSGGGSSSSSGSSSGSSSSSSKSSGGSSGGSIYSKIDQKVGGILPGGSKNVIVEKTKEAISKGYSYVDSKLGGVLPGGVSKSSTGTNQTSSPSGKISPSQNQTSGSTSLYSKADTFLGGYLPGGKTPQEVQEEKLKAKIDQTQKKITSGESVSPNLNIRDQPYFSKGTGKDTFFTNIAETPIINVYEKISGKDIDFNFKKATTKVGDILAGGWGGVWFNSKKTYTPGQEGKEIADAWIDIPKIISDSKTFTLTRGALKDWAESKSRGGKNKYGGKGTTFGEVALVGVGESLMSNPVGAIIYQGLTKHDTWSRDVQKLEDNAVTDIARINIAVENIEKQNSNLNITGYEERAGKYSESIESFNKQAEQYAKDVENFNILYGSGELSKSDYDTAIKQQKNLQNRQEYLQTEFNVLETEQKQLETTFNKYNAEIERNIAELEGYGIKSKVDDKGQYTFSSQALDKKVATTSGLLWKSFKTDEGKLTWKNIAYGGAYIGREAVIGVATGYTLVGITGVGAGFGAFVSKFGKVGKVTAVTLGAGAVAFGTGTSAYSKAKEFESLGMNKIEGAILGGTTNLAKVGGFIYGANVGTKIYYQRLEENILKGKYTKSTAELKQGVKINDKTFAKQVGKYETKIKGTEYKIDSYGRVKSKSVGKTGTSDIEWYSKFSGKAPRGMPKAYQTQGQSLESNNLIRARLYTKSSKGKVWYQQDLILKRTPISQKSVSVKGKPLFEGYDKLQELKFLTSIKAEGSAVKIGKTLPKDIFTSGEKYLFKVQKGALKFGSGSEFAEATPDSLFGTKQYVLFKPSKEIGDIKIQGFDSISKTGGAKVEILKEALKDKILVFNENTKSLGILSMNKKGQIALLSKPPIQPAQLEKSLLKIKPTKLDVSTMDLKPLITQQLKDIVPSVLAKESIKAFATIPTLASLTQIKPVLNTIALEKQLSLNKLKQAMLPKLSQITKINTKVLQVEDVAQISMPKFKMPQLLSSTMSPNVTTPVIPTSVFKPLPIFDLPDLSGYMRQKVRQLVKPGKQRATYVEGFTAKAIDLKPLEIDIKEAKALLDAELTGLEIRRGVVVVKKKKRRR